MALGRRSSAILLSTLVAAAVVAGPAGAAGNWPQLGGDGGRSGDQVVDAGGLPVEPLYHHTEVSDRNIRTSIVTSTGSPATQRLAFGTDDGKIHVRVLLTGTEVGPAGGSSVSTASFPFGGGADSVSLVDTSTADSLGQIFSVHNDTPAAIGLAQIDEASGNEVSDVAVAGLTGYVIDSSPVITAADSSGGRTIFFTAHNGAADELFGLSIANASTTGATAGTLMRTGDINVTPGASPTLVNLENAGGTSTLYVAVGTVDGSLRTFSATDLTTTGPAVSGLGNPVRTASVPVAADGSLPSPAPAVYVAAASATATTVYKLTQTGASAVLDASVSQTVAGEAAPALAVTATHVLVSTADNLYSLATKDLSVSAKVDGSDSLVAGTTGFRYTTAVATGHLVFISDDSGKEYALDDETLAPLAADVFTPDAASAGSASSFGQPAISHRVLQFASNKGLFVYRLKAASPPVGYWQVASDGGLFSYGDVGYFGSTGNITLNKGVVGMAPTPDFGGYWLLASDGGLFAFGDAGFFGSTGNITLNAPIVAMAATPSGMGYWMVASDGGLFAFGDAKFLGSMGGTPLNKPIVGMATTPTGQGYWLVASDGGIFAFGDAVFFGSTGAITLNKPIVGMASQSSGRGYWLVASDGGIFAFGRAKFLGSTGSLTLVKPVVGMAASATGDGYILTASDGGLFAFGDAPYFGSASQLPSINKPIVALAVKP